MFITTVVGGQFGSEAKGHVTWQVIRERIRRHVDNSKSCGVAPREGGRVLAGRKILNIRVAGPNAGHTAYGLDDKPHAFRSLPIGALIPGVKCLISAGSELDFDVLVAEIEEAEQASSFNPNRLYVDPEVTLISKEHKYREADAKLVDRIGSTGKGIGAARADRILRNAERLADRQDLIDHLISRGVTVTRQEDLYFNLGSMLVDDIVIEGTQGFGLGLHAGFYPHCTSSDCRAIDFLAMAGIPIRRSDVHEVFVVFRPYPIRVAGNSGPLVGETTWDMLGLPPEFTTVTKKMRRVGAWDPLLARRAIMANGGDQVRVALSMVDQVAPEVTGVTETAKVIADDKAWAFMQKVEAALMGARIALMTTGPNTAVWL